VKLTPNQRKELIEKIRRIAPAMKKFFKIIDSFLGEKDE